MPLLVRLHLPPRALCFRDLPIHHRVRLCHEYGAPGAKLAAQLWLLGKAREQANLNTEGAKRLVVADVRGHIR
eukprot:1090978-Prorocentrum_lima.AAC.1